MKEQVFITGHQNPDMDSICAAYSYAALKNRVDPDREYHAVRCGNLTKNGEKQLGIVGIEAPAYRVDVIPRVRDVMLTGDGMEASTPLFDLVKTYDKTSPAVLPLFEKGEYFGLLRVEDITAWFLNDNSVEKPVYDFTPENISRVLPGEILHRGGKDSFSAHMYTAAADFDAFCAEVDADNSGMLVTGVRPKHIRKVMSVQAPAIVITGTETAPDLDFSGFQGFVYRTELNTVETIRRLRMAQSVGSIIGDQYGPLQADDLFEDAKELFLNTQYRGFAVFEGKQYAGYLTRRCVLKTPAFHVILVDHNEREQSIRGIEYATIDEILDHHRLNAPATTSPIFIATEPVGSTCTIILSQYRKYGLEPEIPAARAMLTGILSDTLYLKSPTATPRDEEAIRYLGALCGLNVNDYWEALLNATENLAAVEPEEAMTADFKTFEQNGVKFGISQYEVTTLKDVPECSSLYLSTLEKVRKAQGLDLMVFMITDVLREQSVLLTTEHKALKKLPYSLLSTGVYDMPGVMSRKKQLLPAMLTILE